MNNLGPVGISIWGLMISLMMRIWTYVMCVRDHS